MGGFPLTWSLEDAVRQLIASARRAAQTQGEPRSPGRHLSLTKLTLRHRANEVPLTEQSMTTLCSLLPRLRELRIATWVTAEAAAAPPPVVEVNTLLHLYEAVLQPIGQLQLQVLTLPRWVTLAGFRRIFDQLPIPRAEQSSWVRPLTFPLTPCALSLTCLTVTGFPRSTLSEEVMLLCGRMPQMTSLSLLHFTVPAEALDHVKLMPGLTALHFTNCEMLFHLPPMPMLDHLSGLTSLDLGCFGVGIGGIAEVHTLVRCCPQLQSLAGVNVLDGVMAALSPLEFLSSLSISCRTQLHNDEQPGWDRLLSPFVQAEVQLLPQLPALTSLCIRYLPSDVSIHLLTSPLPALQSLEVYIDYSTYQADLHLQTTNCRGVLEADIAVATGACTEWSIRDLGRLSRFKRMRRLASLTRLHYSAPVLEPRIVQVITLLPALQQLMLEVSSPTKWESVAAYTVGKVRELNADPLRCLQDVDLLHLTVLPALHRLELRNVAQLTAKVLPVLACLDGLRELVIRRCAGIDAGEAAELAEAVHSVQAHLPASAFGQPGPLRSAYQRLNRLELDGCLRLPASCQTRLRLQLSAWSALKLCRPRSLSTGAAAFGVHHTPFVPFSLETYQRRVGIRPSYIQSLQVGAARAINSVPPIAVPVAYISKRQQPSGVALLLLLMQGSGVADRWPTSRRRGGMLESAGLYLWLMCAAVGLLCCGRSKPPEREAPPRAREKGCCLRFLEALFPMGAIGVPIPAGIIAGRMAPSDWSNDVVALLVGAVLACFLTLLALIPFCEKRGSWCGLIETLLSNALVFYVVLFGYAWCVTLLGVSLSGRSAGGDLLSSSSSSSTGLPSFR